MLLSMLPTLAILETQQALYPNYRKRCPKFGVNLSFSVSRNETSKMMSQKLSLKRLSPEIIQSVLLSTGQFSGRFLKSTKQDEAILVTLWYGTNVKIENFWIILD